MIHNIAKEALLKQKLDGEGAVLGTSLADDEADDSPGRKSISPMKDTVRNLQSDDDGSSSNYSQANIVEGLLYNSVRRLKY